MRRALVHASGVILAVLAGGALPVWAQDTTSMAQSPWPGTAAPIVRVPLQVDATRLRAGVHHYDVVVTSDSGARTIGTHVVTVIDAMFAGRTAWAVVDQRESFAPVVALVATDTVLLDRTDLRPLRWDAVAANARFVAAFANDSVYGGATSGTAQKTFSAAAGASTVTSEGALDAMLQTLPLATGYAAEAVMLVADLDGPRLFPLHLTVVREEFLELEGGQYNVWVVHAQAGGSERWLWIDKATQVVIRSAMSPGHMPGMIVERVLTLPYDTAW